MHQEPQPSSARSRYITYAQAIFEKRRTSYRELGRRTGIDRTTVSAALRLEQNGNAKLLPVREVIEPLDAALDADGQLIVLWQDAVMESTAVKIKLWPGGLSDTPWRTVDGKEVSPTDRRQLFERMGGVTAASVLAATGEVDTQFRSAEPSITDLAIAETALETLDRDRCTVDPAVLFRPAFEAWESVEGMLARRVHPSYVLRLTLLAGQLAAGLATLSRFGGDDRFRRIFAGIAEKHAAAAGEPMLLARVAGLQSCSAFDAGLYTTAADIAAAGRLTAHPSGLARLAGYEAKAAAAAGFHRRADEALEVMLAGRQAAEKRGNWDEIEEHLYLALAASRSPGDRQAAVFHGQQAASCPCACQGVGLAQAAVGLGLLGGDRPDPDGAAAAGLAALDSMAIARNATVHAAAADLVRQLAPWRTEPSVRELAGRVASV